MIPLKLQLKNFLSYGNTVQTIDFSPYHLICLSGKNGHGKSALLDAITWAIWGQARKVSNAPKADAHLLKLGQTQMMVCLDFICNGQTYRVRREYMQTYGKPITSLDFGILNERQELTALTDKTIKATQHVIDSTLRLTFDAFVNSAFLRQGQANEFSKKSPKERKEIFAQILGLEEYEAIRKLATEKAKEAINQKNSIGLVQDKITIELQQADLIETQLIDIEKLLTELAQQQALQEQKFALCEQEKKALAQQSKEYELLRYKIQELTQLKAKQQKTLAVLQEEWKSVEALTAQAPDLTLLQARKQELATHVALHQKKLTDLLELKGQQLALQALIQQVEQRIMNEHATVVQKKNLVLEQTRMNLDTTDAKLKELGSQQQKKKAELDTLEKNLTQLKTTLVIQAVDEQAFKNLEQKLQQGKETYQHLIAQGNFARQELLNLEHKAQFSFEDENPCCPLCEQNLSVSRKKFLKTKFADQKTELERQLANLAKDIQALKGTLVAEHTVFEKQKALREHNIALSSQYAEQEKQALGLKESFAHLEAQIKEAQAMQAKLTLDLLQAKNDLLAEQKNGDRVLRENPEYAARLTERNNLELALHTIGYDETTHKKTIYDLTLLEQEIARWTQFTSQKALQHEREKQIIALELELKQTGTLIHNITEQEKPFATLAVQEKELAQRELDITTTLQALTANKEALVHNKGAVENQKAKLQKLRLDYEEQAKSTYQLSALADDYYEIAAATSKDGIQALLIENAIPEIEQEANRLLGKLTNNQAQIFIESLRDLKKGGTKETLDINISDAAGIRPYEMFSGGEAFRIDFALRIAISKLLARRAGTALQTLIIDEGFGSQDEEGLSHIMDALYKIQDDFLKVIIVSHLPSMKDQFPVHFVIEKAGEGSLVNIVEMG